jgi:septum formation inhibitor MinC
MSFNNRAPLGSVHERATALREQAEQDQQFAQERQRAMAGRDKSPTGIVRGKYRFDEAKSALGGLNRKIDSSIDEVAEAFKREAALAEADKATRADDAKRAPVLGGNKAGR